MKTIKKIGVLSLAKIQGILMAIFGLIAGIIFALFSTALSSVAGAEVFGATTGVVAIITLTITYGVIGFIAGAIGALIYNLVAGWVGGIQIDLA